MRGVEHGAVIEHVELDEQSG
jgi:hypothetical protein